MTEFFNMLADSFDLPILNWIQANIQCTFLDTTMPVITHMGSAGFLIVFAVFMMLLKKYRRTGFSVALSMVFGLLICNIILKPGIARIRPYDYQEQMGILINLLIEKQHDFSFPSGHTIATFEAATAIFLNHKKMGTVALILASIIAFSRLYLYIHYPTDVFTSIILGVALAILANWIVGKVMAAIEAKKAK